jgi:hypothetical protein
VAKKENPTMKHKKSKCNNENEKKKMQNSVYTKKEARSESNEDEHSRP